MLDLLPPLLAAAAALVAIRGDTWDKGARSWRKITATGWVAAVIALVALVVSILSIQQSHSSRDDRRELLYYRLGPITAQLVAAAERPDFGKLAESCGKVGDVATASSAILSDALVRLLADLGSLCALEVGGGDAVSTDSLERLRDVAWRVHVELSELCAGDWCFEP